MLTTLWAVIRLAIAITIIATWLGREPQALWSKDMKIVWNILWGILFLLGCGLLLGVLK